MSHLRMTSIAEIRTELYWGCTMSDKKILNVFALSVTTKSPSKAKLLLETVLIGELQSKQWVPQRRRKSPTQCCGQQVTLESLFLRPKPDPYSLNRHIDVHHEHWESTITFIPHDRLEEEQPIWSLEVFDKLCQLLLDCLIPWERYTLIVLGLTSKPKTETSQNLLHLYMGHANFIQSHRT